MTQLLSSSIKLNKDQVDTVIHHLAEIRHLTKITKIFEGKPNYGQSDIENLKKLLPQDFDFVKITKFADLYTIYVLSDPKPTPNTKDILNYNPDAKVLNLNKRNEILIVLDTDKFDKQHYLGILGLWPKFYKYLEENSDDVLCPVTITSTNIITQAIGKHFINTAILPCTYRLFSLCEVYPLIGSKNVLWSGMNYDFELLEYEPLYNKGKYSIIYDNDPVVKIMNATKDQLIICKQINNEISPYSEYSIRQVKQQLNDIESLDVSGLNVY
jgi:hypothetical protein